MSAAVKMITYGELRDLIFHILDEYQGPMHQDYAEDEEVSTVLLIILDRWETPTIN